MLSAEQLDKVQNVNSSMEAATSGKLCTSDNLKDVVAYINNRLANVGLPQPLQLLDHPDPEAAAKIVNCLFALLQSKQKDSEYKEEMIERMRRVASENETLTASLNRCKTRLEHTEREVNELSGKFSVIQKQLKQSQDGHHQTKEELKVTKVNLVNSKTQYQHELRKKERELYKIQEKMQKIITDKFAAAKVNLTLVNTLPRAKSGTVSKGKPEEQMFKVIIDNYEEREKELLVENQKLRKSLYDLHRDLRIHIKDYCAEQNPDLFVEEMVDLSGRDAMDYFMNTTSADVAQFSLPYNTIQKAIENKIHGSLHDIKATWDRLTMLLDTQESGQDAAQNTEETEFYRHQIVELRKVIEEQQRLLEMSLNADPNGKAADSFEAADANPAKVDEERNEVYKLRQQLEEERLKFTEAAIRLAKERAAFQKEKDNFENERRVEETHKLLQTMPSTPTWLKSGRPATLDSETPTGNSIHNLSNQLKSSVLSSPVIADSPFANISSVGPNRTATSFHRENGDIIAESDTLCLSSPGTSSFSGTPSIRNQSSSTLKSALKSSNGSSLKKEVKISEFASENAPPSKGNDFLSMRTKTVLGAMNF